MIRNLAGKKLLVCVGPGGVGKTTVSAGLGIVGARAGRRTLVCTIDPAPRLADALGLGSLDGEPRPLPHDTRRALGIDGEAAGELFAARLDTALTFERLVEAHVGDHDMRRRIFANPIYRQITSTLTGSQEYAAMLALHEMATGKHYDLIVLDTPPTANALDFIDAPRRIAEAIASPAVNWFARPAGKSAGSTWERLRAGPALVLRQLGKLVGSRFLDDLGAFLLDFREVLNGFLARARAVETLLREPNVGFLLILSPDVPATNEALAFSARLRQARLPIHGFIVNRILPSPGTTDIHDICRTLGTLPALVDLSPDTLDEASAGIAEVATYQARLGAAQRREVARLEHDAPGADITTLPQLARDVSNLESLRLVGDHLLGRP